MNGQGGWALISRCSFGAARTSVLIITLFYIHPEHAHSKALTRLTESSLHLAEYCLVWYGFTTLVLIHNLRLLTDLLHNPAAAPPPPSLSQHSLPLTHTVQEAQWDLLQIIPEYQSAYRQCVTFQDGFNINQNVSRSVLKALQINQCIHHTCVLDIAVLVLQVYNININQTVSDSVIKIMFTQHICWLSTTQLHVSWLDCLCYTLHTCNTVRQCFYK